MPALLTPLCVNNGCSVHSEYYAVLKGRSEPEIMLATNELHQRRRNHSADFTVTAPTACSVFAVCRGRREAVSEALEGEVRLLESTEQRNRLRTRLGLGSQEHYREKSSSGATTQVAVEITSPPKRRRKPGQRQPRRDPIGLPTTSYATAINV